MFREVDAACKSKLIKPPLKYHTNYDKVWVQTIFTRLKMLGYFAMADRLSPLDRIIPYLISSQTKAKSKLHNDFLAAKLENRFSMKDSRPDL